jgi:HEAT repeat protein
MPSALDARPGLDKALEALKTYDYGQDRKPLQPLDEAVAATHGDAAARKELEKRLADVLLGNAPRDAMDYVCRALRVIGTAESVAALAGLLAERDLSHMARYALQTNPAPEAAHALRDALGTLNGALKVGVIGSLGARRDTESVAALTALLGAADTMVAVAAAHALGTIGTPEAGQALRQLADSPPQGLQQAAADSCLLCAEALLADDKTAEAKSLYKCLTDPKQPKLVRLAATRGILAVVGAKN